MRHHRPSCNRIRRALPAIILAGSCVLSAEGWLNGTALAPGWEANNAGKVASKAAVQAPSRQQPAAPKAQRTPPVQNAAMTNAKSLKDLRDPFRANPGRHASISSASSEKMPRLPGIAGLLVGELQLRGLIEEKATHTMVAVVTNGGTLAYFLHEKDQLYDGAVTQITPTALYLSRKAPPSGVNATKGSVVLHLQPEPGDKP